MCVRMRIVLWTIDLLVKTIHVLHVKIRQDM